MTTRYLDRWECPFQLPACAITVTDDANPLGHTVTIAAGWYRMLFGRSAAGGTATDPKSMAIYLSSIMGAGWTTPVTEDGLPIFSYSGAAGSVAWGAGNGAILRDVLGFQADFGPLNNSQAIANRMPSHVIRARGRVGDLDSIREPAGVAAAERDDGVVYGFSSGQFKIRRKCSLDHHPRDSAFAASTGLLGTPLWHAETVQLASDVQRPVEGLPTAAPKMPHTCHQFLAWAMGRRLALALGTWPKIYATTVTDWDEGYLAAESITKGPEFRTSDNGEWRARQRIGPAIFNIVGRVGFST